MLGFTAWGQIEDGAIVPDLTRRAWADGILAGQDRLTQTGYLDWLESRKSQIGATEYGQRKTETKQLDSIGGYNAKMERARERSSCRWSSSARSSTTSTSYMTVPQAKDVGTKLANYVQAGRRLTPSHPPGRAVGRAPAECRLSRGRGRGGTRR